MRALINIPDRQLEELEAICTARRISRAEVVRQAIDAFISQHLPSRGEAFGAWKGQAASIPCEDGTMTLPEDGLAYQDRLRREW